MTAPLLVTISQSLAAADTADGAVIDAAVDAATLWHHRSRRCAVAGLPVLARTATALPSAGFGSLKPVAAADIIAEAVQYQSRRRSANRWLMMSFILVLSLFTVSLVVISTALFRSEPPRHPLHDRIQSYQANEPSLLVRLSNRWRHPLQKTLRAIQADANFETLDSTDQGYVESRLAEFAAYAAYDARFDPPTLAPRDVRTPRELAVLEAKLAGDLIPPCEFAETEAATRYSEWVHDARVIRDVSEQTVRAARARIREAIELIIAEDLAITWRSESESCLTATNRMPNEPFPASFAIPPAIIEQQATVERAHADWLATRRRLANRVRLYDAAQDLGRWLARVYPRPRS
jgi:hypothetical protein